MEKLAVNSLDLVLPQMASSAKGEAGQALHQACFWSAQPAVLECSLLRANHPLPHRRRGSQQRRPQEPIDHRMGRLAET